MEGAVAHEEHFFCLFYTLQANLFHISRSKGCDFFVEVRTASQLLWKSKFGQNKHTNDEYELFARVHTSKENA